MTRGIVSATRRGAREIGAEHEVVRALGTAAMTADGLYAARAGEYVRFVTLVRYPHALRAWFGAANWLGPGLRVLDAGSGTGIASAALAQALRSRGFRLAALHAFDLTPAMLERGRPALGEIDADDVEFRRADVLALDTLPSTWRGYDVVVSASMLEYVPRDRFVDALRQLRSRLADDGRLVLFISRRNVLMRLIIERWWHARCYDRAELERALRDAGFHWVTFDRFRGWSVHMNLWGHVVEARVGPEPDTP